ncbi:MAG: glycosyltransferase, partial [Patescibacteria group bacterium]
LSGNGSLVYASIPISMSVATILSLLVLRSVPLQSVSEKPEQTRFPRKFFGVAVLNRVTAALFLSLDVILARHYLSPLESGQYALISLVGKMVYFATTLFSQFINPLVSRAEGEGKGTEHTFYRLLTIVTLSATAAFFLVGFFSDITVPVLFGPRTHEILNYLPMYALSMVYFSLATSITGYHQAKRQYLPTISSFILTLVPVFFLMSIHARIEQFVQIMTASSALLFVNAFIVHIFYQPISAFVADIKDLFGLSRESPDLKRQIPAELRILIFNWRDTRHKWAGGAESYLHKIAKQLVLKGHKVTVFCGNDRLNPRNEVVDGVQIVRRGGFYTVYLWAFLYYMLKFRGLFDVVIDSENGVPFFTPLYVEKPVFLLIHHIHQEVFQKHLRFPFSQIARFVESKLMPLVYRNRKIITVSSSSKEEIVDLGLGKSEHIDIINPGLDLEEFVEVRKTAHPQLTYLGRLKPYKNIDVLLRAYAKIIPDFPSAKLVIAGEGESFDMLKELSTKLKIDTNTVFTGRVSEDEKRQILGASWALVQPSSIEGWGLTVIEANAAGTPVVASDVSGLRDSVVNGITGILVTPQNDQLLTNAILDMIQKRTLRTTLSKNAMEWARGFSWASSADKFRGIIVKALIRQNLMPLAGKIAFIKK